MKLDLSKFEPSTELWFYYKKKETFEQAWNECERGDWMLWIAATLEVDDRLIHLAAGLCANTVRSTMCKKSIKALDAALGYGKGEIDRKKLTRAYKNVYPDPASYYTSSILAAAYAATPNTIDCCYAVYYTDLIWRMKGGWLNKLKNEKKTAKICRQVLTEAVMEKAKALSDAILESEKEINNRQNSTINLT